ncbi:MAG: YARHG domain-containing protein [Lachnospiraceae bacterium]|nr:YARHG domain-containing protein [Lachnospiraceae bacterium]
MSFEQKGLLIVVAIIIGVGVIIAATFILRKNEKTIEADNAQQAKGLEKTPAKSHPTVKQDAEQEDQELFQQEQDVNGEYIFPDSDKYYLSEDEVRNKSSEELLIGRNEIFARHEYIFETGELQEHFENTSWYYGAIPGDQFDMDAVFNEFEKKNVELIKNIENELNNPCSQENKRQTLANETSQTLDFNLTVINNTGFDIYRLYASETDTDDWEEDILEDDILYAGGHFYITFTIDADSLKWDFAIQDEYEKQTEFYDLSFAGCNVEGATLVLWREDGETHASLY